MRIIGIDPGTGRLGFGVVDAKAGKLTLVDAGIVTTPPHTPTAVRLEDIYESLTGIIKATNPSMMAIEKLFFARNVTTAMSVAEARGVALLVAQQAGLKIEEYTPMQIKQSITGYGKADKKQMQEMVRLQLGLKTVPKPDDAADALAAAIMCGALHRDA